MHDFTNAKDIIIINKPTLNIHEGMNNMNKPYKLWYDKPAPNRGKSHEKITEPTSNWAIWSRTRDPDWEAWSLPLGCGHFGINVFGRTDTERIQVTEISLANPYPHGVNSFAELYLDINHPETDITDYTRTLTLNDATANTRYTYQGVVYEREHFTSYPDNIMVVRLSASQKGKITFTLRAETPYVQPYGTKDYLGNVPGKTGWVKSNGNRITLGGEMEYYGIIYEGQICVGIEGGSIEARGGHLYIHEADTAVIRMAVGTNYVLQAQTFLEKNAGDCLKGNPHPHGRVTKTLNAAIEIPSLSTVNGKTM